MEKKKRKEYEKPMLFKNDPLTDITFASGPSPQDDGEKSGNTIGNFDKEE